MSGISTHILDVSRGVPAAGVRVVLEHETGGKWATVADIRTDTDGRVKNLLPPTSPLSSGSYRIRFATGAYWINLGISAFHPHVEVVFTVADAGKHHHVPLLLSPFGYTTYRGT